MQTSLRLLVFVETLTLPLVLGADTEMKKFNAVNDDF